MEIIKESRILDVKDLIVDLFKINASSDLISVLIGPIPELSNKYNFLVFTCVDDGEESFPIQPIKTSEPSIPNIIQLITDCLIKSGIKIFGADIYDTDGCDVDVQSTPNKVIYDIYFKDERETLCDMLSGK